MAWTVPSSSSLPKNAPTSATEPDSTTPLRSSSAMWSPLTKSHPALPEAMTRTWFLSSSPVLMLAEKPTWSRPVAAGTGLPQVVEPAPRPVDDDDMARAPVCTPYQEAAAPRLSGNVMGCGEGHLSYEVGDIHTAVEGRG